MNSNQIKEEISEINGFIKGLELAIDFGYMQVGPCTYQEIEKPIVNKIEDEIKNASSKRDKLLEALKKLENNKAN